MTTEQPTSSASDSTSSQPNNLAYSKQLEGTPFRMIKQDENQYFAVCGDYQITPILSDAHAVYQYIKHETWQITLTLILIVLDKHKLINHN